MLGPTSDRACVLSDSETVQVNVMKLMVVAPAGWINQKQEELGSERGEVQCRERLGGLLRYYYRDAA